MPPVIFVVDDDPAISRLLRATLEAEAFAVRIFATASSLLDLAPPVVMSLELPDYRRAAMGSPVTE